MLSSLSNMISMIRLRFEALTDNSRTQNSECKLVYFLLEFDLAVFVLAYFFTFYFLFYFFDRQ